jgi:hypothetical protein
VGLGRVARFRALLAPDDEAERQYRRSIEVLGGADSPTELARSHLVYGEWLRCQRSRQEARDQLGAAFGALTDIGARASPSGPGPSSKSPAAARARRRETSLCGTSTRSRCVIADSARAEDLSGRTERGVTPATAWPRPHLASRRLCLHRQQMLAGTSGCRVC